MTKPLEFIGSGVVIGWCVIIVILIAHTPVAVDTRVATPKVATEPVSLSTAPQPRDRVNTAFKPSLEVQLPRDYHPVALTLKRTHQVGTALHPTIDGGIINTTDHHPIHDEAVRSEPAADRSRAPISATQDLKPISTSAAFDDHWATFPTLERQLQHAAAEGKLAYVLKVSHRLQLPASVALLPMVESGYRTHVTSPKGAAGAWQLMPAVAHDYGVSLESRYHFKSSTNTALQLLSDLHQHFQNWELTFAAYNAGSARVERALHQNPHAQGLDDLNLPPETKQYVARLNHLSLLLGGNPNAI